MKLNFKHTAAATLIIITLVGTVVWQASAQQDAAFVPAVGNTAALADYELAGSVGAGGTAAAGSYQTDVIIGQTAVRQHANGDYELGSGVWGGGIVSQVSALLELYLPLILH